MSQARLKSELLHLKKPAFTIADAIEALENIPKEKRQLPFKVFDWN